MLAYEQSNNASFAPVVGIRGPAVHAATLSSKATKASNWSILLPALVSCGVIVDTPTKGRILYGDLPAALEVMAKFRKQLLLRYPPKNHNKVGKRVSLQRQAMSKISSEKHTKPSVQSTAVSGPAHKLRKHGAATAQTRVFAGKESVRGSKPPDSRPRKATKKGTARQPKESSRTNHSLHDTFNESLSSSEVASKSEEQRVSPVQPKFTVDQHRLQHFADSQGAVLRDASSVLEFLVVSLSKSLSAHPTQV